MASTCLPDPPLPPRSNGPIIEYSTISTITVYNGLVIMDASCNSRRIEQARRNRLLRAVIRLSNAYRRMLAVALALIGPRVAYRITGRLARVLYRSLEPIRARSEAQCRAALSGQIAADDIPRIAEEAFTHRIWNLADLMLADRFLHRNTYYRYGGRIPEPYLGALLRAQGDKHPVILVTAYYGPFDLLPVFLGYNGIRAGVIYRPHPNASFDVYRRRIRERSGCELVPLERAGGHIARLLEQGGTVAIVADHHAERRGLPVTFLGLPTMALRSVGMLAQHYGASVAVAGIRRVGQAFRFEILVSSILQPNNWASASDPVAHITAHYLNALERIIIEDPTQYLWSYARWGEDAARRLTEDADPLRPDGSTTGGADADSGETARAGG
jgi:KDO2-lipid IV(A) lauroyltransferase